MVASTHGYFMKIICDKESDIIGNHRRLHRVWFGKDVSYDHMCVFGCKAFVHVSKDEIYKLDVKTRQCIFIDYGLDGEFGHRLYDPVQKKLDIGDFDAPIDDVVNDQQLAPIAPPTVPLRRSSGDRRPSVRIAMKWIMRYFRGSSNLKLCFDNAKHVLVGYTGSDMARGIDLRRSILGYLITYAGELWHGN
ncbi:hypothetical protein V6N12_058398 [Hibiscus sabdariffa]|uniref:Retroviral polymerase SH3-like domain-containing protein n=1 Tax=Hibiscus sabdariffa TaxID=183260 RepID=A0ABR2ESG4_9ROSI